MFDVRCQALKMGNGNSGLLFALSAMRWKLVLCHYQHAAGSHFWSKKVDKRIADGTLRLLIHWSIEEVVRVRITQGVKHLHDSLLRVPIWNIADHDRRRWRWVLRLSGVLLLEVHGLWYMAMTEVFCC